MTEHQHNQPVDPTAHCAQLLRATLDPDTRARIAAESALGQLSHRPGFAAALLHVIRASSSDPGDTGVRQSAAIYLKNLVRRAWTPDTPSDPSAPLPFAIPDVDKLAVRQHLLPAIVESPTRQIRAQLQTALVSVLESDFPQQWPTYVDDVAGLLSSANGTPDMAAVYAGLVGMLAVVRIYQWRAGDKRAPLNKIVKNIFPMILAIAQRLVAEPATNVAAGEMLKTVLKTYWTAIQYELPRSLQDDSTLIAWGNLFVTTVTKPIPGDALAADCDDEERAQFSWWKAKKWAVYALNKLFTRYGNASLDTFREESPAGKSFAKNFMEKFAPVIVGAFMHEVELVNAGQLQFPRKIANVVLGFFTDCIKHKITWAIMKPKLEPLATQFAFGYLCFTDEDAELWEDEPVEYLQKKVDPFEDFQNPSQSALRLFVSLVKDRPKQTFIPILTFINHLLTAGDGSAAYARRKDGALALLAALCDPLLGRKSPVRAQLPDLLRQHVLPELTSTAYPFLVVRACDVVKTYCESDDFEFGDDEAMAQQAWAHVFGAVFQAMHSTDVVVRVYSAICIGALVERESLREIVVPQLAFIMETLLKLTNSIDMDLLTGVMERLVELFPNELIPFSVQLCSQLRDTFIRIMTESRQAIDAAAAETGGAGDDTGFDEWDINGDRTMAAMGIIKTISTLVLGVPDEMEGRDSLLEQLELAFIPVIAYTVEHEVLDLYDEIFELLDSATFQLKRITPTTWAAFPAICQSLQKSGIDFIEEILPALDNYIMYGREAFASNLELVHMMVGVIERIVNHESLDAMERIYGFKLMESLLLNCRGALDALVDPFISLALEKMQQSKATPFVVHCLEVPINCMYYNPALTLSILESKNAFVPFLQAWLDQHASKFARVHDKKLSASALMEMITTMAHDARILELLRSTAPGLMKALVGFLAGLPKAEEARDEMLKMYADDESDDEDGEDEDEEEAESEYGDDDEDEDEEFEDGEEVTGSADVSGDVPDEDAEYLKYLASQERGEHATGANSDSDDDDDEDWSQQLSEELYFESPLDDVDVYVRFQDLLGALNTSRPDVYALLTSQLTIDDQQHVHTLLAKADERRKEVAEKLEKEAAKAMAKQK